MGILVVCIDMTFMSRHFFHGENATSGRYSLIAAEIALSFLEYGKATRINVV